MYRELVKEWLRRVARGQIRKWAEMDMDEREKH